jgi:hypothetical protein
MAPDATMAPSDDMLREPNGVADAPLTLQRAVLDYTARDERFALDKKIYGQYFQLYFQRLMLLAPRLKQAVAAKWPGVKTSPVLDLKEGEECVIMGTLYKDMKLKPSILDEYVKEAGAKASDVAGKKFVSDDDSLVLEDEGARVKLTGKGVAVDCFVTGVVLAVKGRVVANGEFEVDEICYPAPAPQTTRPSRRRARGRTCCCARACARATTPPPPRSTSSSCATTSPATSAAPTSKGSRLPSRGWWCAAARCPRPRYRRSRSTAGSRRRWPGRCASSTCSSRPSRRRCPWT